jgi:hypothetical protein
MKKKILIYCFAFYFSLFSLNFPLYYKQPCVLLASASFASQEKESDEEVVHHYVEETLQHVVRPPKGLLPYPYVIPSAPAPGSSTNREMGTYLQMYDWDSFFEGVRLSLDGKAMLWKDTILDFLAQTQPNGYTPRTIDPHRYWDFPDQCKPFLCQGAYLASKSLNDFSWLKGETYKKLASTLRYWETHRLGADGLYVWHNAVESGVDNSLADLSAPPMTVEGVDLNCYLVREYQALSLIAEKLGKHHDAKIYQEKGDRLAKLINEEMWDPKDQIYYSLDSRTGKPIRIKDWTCFVPLWAGIVPKNRAKILIEKHLLNPKEFWGNYGIPSLAFDEVLHNDAKRGFIPGYHTVSNWQGPVWIVANYIIMQGLLRYGYQKEAEVIANQIVKLVADDVRKSGGAHENYDSKTGEPLWADNFGSWDLLVDQMQTESRQNFDPTALK